MLWCDWEHVGPDLGAVDKMRLALKKLGGSVKFPDPWQSFHKGLFQNLREALGAATTQKIAGWWHSCVSKVLIDFGLPESVTRGLSACSPSVTDHAPTSVSLDACGSTPTAPQTVVVESKLDEAQVHKDAQITYTSLPVRPRPQAVPPWRLRWKHAPARQLRHSLHCWAT